MPHFLKQNQICLLYHTLRGLILCLLIPLLIEFKATGLGGGLNGLSSLFDDFGTELIALGTTCLGVCGLGC